jgi:hypothetical protein
VSCLAGMLDLLLLLLLLLPLHLVPRLLSVLN